MTRRKSTRIVGPNGMLPQNPEASMPKHEHRFRDEMLGFRVDETTKALVERAAQLERRKIPRFLYDRHNRGRSPDDRGTRNHPSVRAGPSCVF